jgi:hypothetical protein
MIGYSNQDAVDSFSKYPSINRFTTTKCGSSSSSRTPPQPELQHGLTTGLNLWDKSGFPLKNQCVLSDRQATHHHLRKRWGTITSSSLSSMYIQFRTLTFYSRPEEQLQECLRLKKFATSLSATIRALGSPLGPHPESGLATDL